MRRIVLGAAARAASSWVTFAIGCTPAQPVTVPTVVTLPRPNAEEGVAPSMEADAGTDADASPSGAPTAEIGAGDARCSAPDDLLATALPPAGTGAAVPAYLTAMHSRIHPVFASSLAAIEAAWAKNGLRADPRMVTRVEIVLTKKGDLVKMGIVKTSGLTAFDIEALAAIDHARPFGPAPAALQSADGRVYVQWDFHRDASCACTAAGAALFVLDGGAPGRTP
jgi:TonB family protein